MNVFFLHNDPREAARAHCDKHVGKMLIEACQLLSCARESVGMPLIVGHPRSSMNHPCARWTRECVENYEWLLELAQALALEHTLRFGTCHTAARALSDLRERPPLPRLGSITPPALAMPTMYWCDNPVEAYRNYYSAEKRRFAVWRHTPAPLWW